MTSFVDFISDSKVHDAALMSMVVTSLIGALPVPGTKASWGMLYEIPYKWLTGFWSLRTGQADRPISPVSIPAQPK